MLVLMVTVNVLVVSPQEEPIIETPRVIHTCEELIGDEPGHTNPCQVSFYLKSDDHPLHLMWAGKSMPEMYWQNVRLMIRMRTSSGHPVFIWSNELKWNRYVERQRRVFLVRYNVAKMLPDNKMAKYFTDHMNKTTPVHLSDLVRLTVIYIYGGIFMDTDMIPVRDMKTYDDSVGLLGVNSVYKCLNCVKGRPDLPAVTHGSFKITCACSCLLSFKKNSPFIRDALEMSYEYFFKVGGFETYSPGGGCLLMEVLQHYSNSKLISPVDAVTSFCEEYSQDFYRPVQANKLKRVMDSCYVIHMYGGGKTVGNPTTLRHQDWLVSKVYQQVESLVNKSHNHVRQANATMHN